MTRLGEARADTSAGYAFPGAELRIVDPADGRLPAGKRGEIWLRGVGLMPGYFRDPQATADVMRDGGWYASGDLGELHDDGALFIVGRLKEMIVRSGFNVSGRSGTGAQPLSGNPELGRRRAAGSGRQRGRRRVRRTGCRAAAGRNRAGPVSARTACAVQAPGPHHSVDALPFNSNGKLMRRQLLERL